MEGCVWRAVHGKDLDEEGLISSSSWRARLHPLPRPHLSTDSRAAQPMPYPAHPPTRGVGVKLSLPRPSPYFYLLSSSCRRVVVE